MDIKKHIDSIELLCKELESAGRKDKILIYTSIKQLVDDVSSFVTQCRIEGNNIGLGNSGIYLTELISHLRAVSGLETNSHPDEVQYSWVRTSIEKLRSIHCFDL